MYYGQSLSPNPIKSEDEILDIKVRQQIIGEINGSENGSRKQEALRRYECYKDKTSKWVIDSLLKQFDYKTVLEMSYAISNISIVRKVINKLAMVYGYGVRRELPTDELTARLEAIERILKYDQAMKKENRAVKLQRNSLLYIKPCQVEDMWTIKLEVMHPFAYDVVEDYYDREKPLCVILSPFRIQQMEQYSLTPATEGRGFKKVTLPIISSDGVDQKIADSPDDQENHEGEYIWWSKKYHFTTNGKGQITSQGDTINPIGLLTFVNYALDQDGSFWAQGGDDLADGGVNINSMLSHLHHVGVTQGYGQFWMRGNKVPTSVAMGPSKMIRLEFNEGESTPEIGYSSANPQLTELRESIITDIALLLTTNNLSTSGVSTKLDGATSFPAGIAMIIDKAESLEDISDQRQLFADNEPLVWQRIGAWLEYFGSRGLLVSELQALRLTPGFEEDLRITFQDPQPIMSEAEKLGNLKLRQDLGINTRLDLMMLDNPQLTKDQAQEKIDEIQEEKRSNVDNAVSMIGGLKNGQGPADNSLDGQEEQTQ